ncbi:hypothetical protein [Xenophilus sp. Marseille-Q4582]|uniref:hypothetical protein n=1 Tax=Xenophilus sp. Marseille-Q4582 TaxID=2866600 RepID=UPI001CE487F3|nr:hypothetical protein [Xenophilus sp. Marseille-Q4582]
MLIRQIADVAVDAQRELMQANDVARSPQVPAGPRQTLARYAAVQRARLAVCAEHFAALQPANDPAMEAVPA